MDCNERRLLALPLAMLLFIGAIFVLGACPLNNNNGGGEECPPCDDGYVCDAATGRCILGQPNGGNGEIEDPLCGSDLDDCGPGEVCDLATGECVEGKGCDPGVWPMAATNSHCNWNTETNANHPGWACGGSTRDDCICDPTDNTCKRRRQTCEPCTDDEECGPHEHFENPAECVDTDEGKVCLVVTSPRGCPAGYLSRDGYCRPAEGSCEDVFACTSDADCPEDRPVCHRASGTCRAGCVFDFIDGDSVGCPPNQVCHGDGRCRAPCDGDASCREINSSYICYDEPLGPSRCRVGGCLHDNECPVPTEGPYLGFCDLILNTCFEDRCHRTDFDGGAHPNPDRHCRDGYACRDGGFCEQMACTERSAPNIACGYHQFCCGFCRNETGNPERDACDPTPCPPTFETPPGAVEGCFLADKSKWCNPCEDDANCAHIENPASDPRDVNICRGESCLLTCETGLDCPVQWRCEPLVTACETHDDCSPGQCLRIDPDNEESLMVCMCDNDGSLDDNLCPPDTRCMRWASRHMCGIGLYCIEQVVAEGEGYCEQ